VTDPQIVIEVPVSCQDAKRDQRFILESLGQTWMLQGIFFVNRVSIRVLLRSLQAQNYVVRYLHCQLKMSTVPNFYFKQQYTVLRDLC
jgi:hypothetical protein